MHRLTRLALLTQGVALVGAGAAGAACGKESGLTGRDHEPLHINATMDPDASVPPPDAAREALSAHPDGAAGDAAAGAADAAAKHVANRPRMNATAPPPPAPPAPPTTKPSAPSQGR
jgi:hypothetical protein